MKPNEDSGLLVIATRVHNIGGVVHSPGFARRILLSYRPPDPPNRSGQ